MAYSLDAATDLAIRILAELAGRPEDFQQFMHTAGLQPENLRELSRLPDIYLFLFDFILEDDARVLQYAHALGLRPQDIMAASMVLAGPGSFGWSAD